MIRESREIRPFPLKRPSGAGKDTVSVGVLASAWADGNLRHGTKMVTHDDVATTPIGKIMLNCLLTLPVDGRLTRFG